MANPVLIVCTENAWTKVATNVTSGQIHDKASRAVYFQTYRTTGDPAPLNTDLTDAVPIFNEDKSVVIANSTAIDVYIHCIGEDGRVRVDL